MDKKEILSLVIQNLQEELIKRQAKLELILNENFDLLIEEENIRLNAEIVEKMEIFKKNIESTIKNNADIINTDIMAINRIIADKVSEFSTLETAPIDINE